MKIGKVLIAQLFVWSLTLLSLMSNGEKIVWDLKQKWGVDQQGIANAIAEAKVHFNSFPDDSIVINIPEGTFNIGGNNSHSIDISDVKPGGKGRLIFSGAGKDKTTLIATDPKEHSIYGRNIYRITFKGIHFTRDYCCVSQGTVVKVSSGEVVLDLHEGFPTPDSLWQYGIVGGWGMYFRKFTDDIDNPQIITDDNDQVAWNKDGTYKMEGNHWKFALKNLNETAPYKAGDIIGIKLKHGGQTYWFAGGDDITFEDCKWTQKTRGVLRSGISNIKFIDCVTERGPRIGGRVPCLASPGGGPQCGQPDDAVINNVLIENCFFFGSGDDNVAFFNVDGGTISNCHITDSFARGIFLYHCKNICIENNTIERCPVLWEEGDGFSKCDYPVSNLNDNYSSGGIKVYPNPFTSCFFIKTDAMYAANTVVSLFDLFGKNIFSICIPDFVESEIIPGNISPECYLLKVQDEEKSYTQFLIKR